jgi:CRP-like cAMP-binding protein
MRPTTSELRSIPLFEPLTEDQIEQVAGRLEVRSVDVGQRLTLTGASGYSFFVIQSGTADVRQEGEGIGTLGPGDFFGELAILGRGQRTADVVASSPMKLLVMFGADFRRLQAELPEVASRIEKVAAGRAERG